MFDPLSFNLLSFLFPGWMVVPLALGFSGPKIPAQQAPKPAAPPAPPAPSSATAATRYLLRDVASQRSRSTTILGRVRETLTPGTNDFAPPRRTVLGRVPGTSPSPGQNPVGGAEQPTLEAPGGAEQPTLEAPGGGFGDNFGVYHGGGIGDIIFGNLFTSTRPRIDVGAPIILPINE